MHGRSGEPSAQRILLLELLLTTRFLQRRSEALPYLGAYARSAGQEVRWLAFGVKPPAPPADPFRMALPDGDVAALAGAIREFRPTLILHNEEFEPSLARVVREAAGAARVEFLADRFRKPEWMPLAALDRLIGIAPRATDAGASAGGSGERLVDAVEPDYACELMNDAARQIKPFIPLSVGLACSYRRRVAANPAYAGIALEGVVAEGCAFCDQGNLDPSDRPATAPIDLAVSQMRRSRATCPPDRFSGCFRSDSGLLFLRVDELFERLLADGAPPTTILFSVRIDELNRKADALRGLLPRLRDAGHCIGIDNMGLENFSEAENGRFNKGVSAAEADRAHDTIREWEAAYPDTFKFHEWGGFSFILFTPWTTLADLRINMEGAKRFRLGHGNFFFASRLQLRPGHAITELARRDGLLVESGGSTHGADPVCLQKRSDVELDWRFCDPVVAAIHRIAHLARHRATATEDPLWGELTSLPGAHPSRLEPGIVVPALVQLATDRPELRTAEDLLRAHAKAEAERLGALTAEGPAAAHLHPASGTEPGGALGADDASAWQRVDASALEALPPPRARALRSLLGWLSKAGLEATAFHAGGALRFEIPDVAQALGKAVVLVKHPVAGAGCYRQVGPYAILYAGQLTPRTRQLLESISAFLRVASAPRPGAAERLERSAK